MKVSQCGFIGTGFAVVFFFLLLSCTSLFAQTNSWIGSGSGDWESPEWSLGLPGTNENIYITNAGSKVIVIEPTTVQNYPQTLTVHSLTISSQGLEKEVLMNQSGLETPLLIGDMTDGDGSLIVGSNCVFEMFGSSLVVANPGDYATWFGPGDFHVGGLFNESDNSSVLCGSIYVGNIGPAVFNLTNSSIQAFGAEYVGGYPSTFNQNSGTNTCFLLILNGNGIYNLDGGSVFGIIQGSGGSFVQKGGTVSGQLYFADGAYTLSSGILYSTGVVIPGAWEGGGNNFEDAVINQNGGIHYASTITVGTGAGTGSYNLSAGTLYTTNLVVDVGAGLSVFAYNTWSYWAGSFTQSGGVHSNVSMSIQGSIGGSEPVSYTVGSYNLNGGILQTGTVMANGSMNQSGGTNFVGTFGGNYTLTGGVLIGQNVGGVYYDLGVPINSDLHQSGGTNISGILSGNYSQSDGLLIATNVQLTNGAVFQHTGGICGVSLLTLDNGIWQEDATGQALGQLQLGAGTNSILQLPTNVCEFRFANSSDLNWSNTGVLTIVNWNGFLTGGGSNQIIFGNSSNALTAQQLSQIQFANPAGLAAGNYLAKILPTGEIVPGNHSFLDGAPAPFFTGEAAMGGNWFYLSQSNSVFGYYYMNNFPYVGHEDMGWEYFEDDADGHQGAYFYDFTDSAWFYTQPSFFPFLYDFNANAWMYYEPLEGASGRYTSNPRWFYNFSTQAWSKHL